MRRTRYRVIVAVLAASVSSASVSTKVRAEPWLSGKAKEALAAGNPGLAVRILRAELEFSSETAEKWIRLARIEEQRGHFVGACAAWEKALALGPKDTALVRKKLTSAKERSRSGGYRQSVDEEDRATELAKEAFRLGRKAALSSRYTRGIRYLRAAAILDPKLPGPHRLLGLTLMRVGRSKDGSRHLAEYLRIRPAGNLSNRIRKLLRKRGILGWISARASFPSQLWVNGQYTGLTTPVKRFALPAGSFIVTLSSAKYHLARDFRVAVASAKTSRVDLRFGVIENALKPWGRIVANGRDLGLWDLLGLPAGRYELEVIQFDGRRRAHTTWVVQPRQTRKLTWDILGSPARK